jgi:Uma2 family endonuclease
MSQPAVSALAPLPFELVYDDGEPLESDWHARQLPLLREVIDRMMAEQGCTDYHVGTNMFVYYSVEQAWAVAREEADERLPKRTFRGPDVFWVGGVARYLRKAWVAWEEGGRLPDVIVELLSPTTAEIDRTEKKDIYAKIFGTKEYFLVDPESREVEGFELVRGVYRAKVPTAEGRVWCAQLEAYVGFWHGEWTEITADWCRLFHADGSLVPTKAEAAQQQADVAQQQAAEERRRADAAEAELKRLRALLEERSSG